jgi:hypothetical protein
MLWTDTAEDTFLTNHGGVVLADWGTFPGLRKVIESQGYLCASLAVPGPAQRGRLAMTIEESIELALERLGAVAPGVGASANVDASISDQLYRARLVEKRGIVVMIPNLEGMANLNGTLDGEDSVTLAWWIQATQERPLGLVIESINRVLKVYPSPVAFEALLRTTSYPPPPPTAPEQAASSEAMDLSEPPPVVDIPTGLSETPYEAEEPERASTPEPAFADELVQALLEGPEASSDEAPAPNSGVHEVEAPSEQSEETHSLRGDRVDLEAIVLLPLTDDIPAADREMGHETGSEEGSNTAGEAIAPAEPRDVPLDVPIHDARTVRMSPPEALLEAERRAGEPLQVAAHDVDVAQEPSASSAPEHSAKREEKRDEEAGDPFHRMAQREWTNWMRELSTTRGPKPLAVVERTFVAAYTPLKEAWLRNIAAPEATGALRTFSDSFEHSYSEAFDALRVRGKRPTMVLDVPEIAQRIGRLHGARSIQLLLVDAMRFDIGLRVQDRIRQLSRGHVSLAERLLLWSALPTNTETQLELLGKGAAGLKEPITPSETPVVVARGKNAATPRRIKAGPRELIKLDIIEANLAEPGKAEAQRLDEIADEIADVAVEQFKKLPPRTLVMMFGDHGFLFDPMGKGTSPGRSGGASPEEVLVPAFAWLVGSVH